MSLQQQHSPVSPQPAGRAQQHPPPEPAPTLPAEPGAPQAWPEPPRSRRSPPRASAQTKHRASRAAFPTPPPRPAAGLFHAGFPPKATRESGNTGHDPPLGTGCEGVCPKEGSHRPSPTEELRGAGSCPALRCSAGAALGGDMHPLTVCSGAGGMGDIASPCWLVVSQAPPGWSCGRASAEVGADHEQGGLCAHRAQSGYCWHRRASALPPPQPHHPWAHQGQLLLPAKGDPWQPWAQRG